MSHVENQFAPLTPEQVIAQLRALHAQIPEFVQLPKEAIRKFYRHASVNPVFTRESVGLFDASPIVESAIGSTSEELRREEEELARWTAVESEYRAGLRGVSAANLVRRERLGRTALQAFALAKQLARQAEHAALLPYVERLARIRKLEIRRRPRTPAESNAPQETTQD